MRASIWLFPVFAALSCLPAAANTVYFTSLAVPGNSVIESANGNISASALSAMNGTAAVLALGFSPAVAGETITINAITGEVGCCNSIDSYPDGGTDSSINISSSGSLSGFVGPYSVPLTGVFTTSAPPSGAPPATLTYAPSDLQDASYSPLLNQVFFIGDGYTGNDIGTPSQTGSQQVFNVPVGGTQFFLGIEDACNFNGSPGCYGDNPGSFTVNGQLNNVPGGSSAPEPGAMALIGLGLTAIGLRLRRG